MIQIQTSNRDKVTERSTSDIDYSVVREVNVEQCWDLSKCKALDLLQMVVAETKDIKRNSGFIFNISPEVEMSNAEQRGENGSADVRNVVMREVNI